MKLVSVLLLLSLFHFSNAFTCDQVKGLYTANDCCSTPTDPICSEIASGDRLANLFTKELTKRDGQHILVEGIISNNNINPEGTENYISVAGDITWSDIENFVFSEGADATQYDYLRKNLATLAAIKPLDLVALMTGQATST